MQTRYHDNIDKYKPEAQCVTGKVETGRDSVVCTDQSSATPVNVAWLSTF